MGWPTNPTYGLNFFLKKKVSSFFLFFFFLLFSPFLPPYAYSPSSLFPHYYYCQPPLPSPLASCLIFFLCLSRLFPSLFSSLFPLFLPLFYFRLFSPSSSSFPPSLATPFPPFPLPSPSPILVPEAVM